MSSLALVISQTSRALTDCILSSTVSLGANAHVQAVRFALCFALGIAAGTVALLYLRKASPLERALTDFFATACIAMLFLVCVEFFLNGKPELYGAIAYVAGVIVLPLIFRKIQKLIAKRKKK